MPKKQRSRELAFPWYLEPNGNANSILAELIPENECREIPDGVGVTHNLWGCDNLGGIIDRFFQAQGASGVRIVVWKRTEDKCSIVRKGIVSA